MEGECDSKIEEGESSCEERVANNEEPHVTFHDGSTYNVPAPSCKPGDYIHEVSVPVRSAFNVPTLSYASPTAMTPKVTPSYPTYTTNTVSHTYPNTYSIGGQNVPYFSTSSPTVQNTYSVPTVYSGAASTPYFPTTTTTGSAQVSSRAVPQYATYTAKYPTAVSYSPFEVATNVAPQTYTTSQTTYTPPQTTSYTAPQTYTLQTPQTTYTTPQTVVPQQSYTTSFQVPTTEENSFPFNYPVAGAYPANYPPSSSNFMPFTQDELAAYYQNYLAGGQEPLAEQVRTPSYRGGYSVKEVPTLPSKQCTKKLPPAKLPLQRKKKGCCGC